MVAFKAAQTASLLDSLPGDLQAVLLYGPEPGVVSGRADLLAARLAASGDEIVRLDETDLAHDPARLEVTLRTPSLFGGNRIVRLRSGARLDEAGLADLLDEPLACFLIVEAGNLRPTSKLRRSFEEARRAAALPCHGAPTRDIRQLIAGELAAAGLRIDAETQAYLADQLGTDIAVARQELAKLILYVGASGTVTVQDVAAVVGDTSAAAADVLASAVAAGAVREALRQFDRLRAAGTSAQSVLSALARHFERLHRVKALTQSGSSVREAIAGLRPPPRFEQRDALAAQVRRWSLEELARAIELIQQTTFTSRLTPDLEQALVEQALLSLAARHPA